MNCTVNYTGFLKNNQQLKDGPGSVCSSDDVPYTLEEVTDKWIEVAVSSVNERVTLPIN